MSAVHNEALTDSERQDLEATRDALRDVYGTSNLKSFEQGEAMLASARNQLAEALHLLPGDGGLRDAYDEAMKIAPQLVERESNPDRFLRACHYDPWATANNIAVYWKTRKLIFGERAFLPMNLTGQGALSSDIVEAMKCGGMVLLPPDSSNRPVLYVDRRIMCSRCTDGDARVQLFFYTFQALFECDDALENGFVIMTTFDTTNKHEKKNTFHTGVLDFFRSGAIPVVIKALHIIVFRKRSLLETSIPIWLKLLERSKFLSMRSVVHFGGSETALFGDLEQYGFVKEGLPKTLGGALDFDGLVKRWLDSRMKAGQGRNSVAIPAAEAAVIWQSCQDPGGVDQSDLSVVVEESRKEDTRARKRKLDAIYQKRKREQNKRDFAKLTEELNLLQKDNFALKADQTFLESLVERAVQVEALCDRLMVGTITPSLTQSAHRPAGLLPQQSMTPLHLVHPVMSPTTPLAAAAGTPNADQTRPASDRALLERLAVLQRDARGTGLYQNLQQDVFLRLRSQMVHEQNMTQQHTLNQHTGVDVASLGRLVGDIVAQQHANPIPQMNDALFQQLRQQQRREEVPHVLAAARQQTMASGVSGARTSLYGHINQQPTSHQEQNRILDFLMASNLSGAI